MAISDIASLVVGKIFDSAEPISQAIDNSMAAEPGPPTGVRPFTGADASAGALMAKLGARVFQRARERKMANDKANKARLDEEYRRAQIEHLTSAATAQQEPRDRSITLHDGTVITGLTPQQQAQHLIDLQNDPPAEEMVKVDERGKPLPFPMKRSEYLTYRGQNLSDARAAAARSLAERLGGQRTRQAGTSAATLAQTRYLGSLPSEGEVWNTSVAQAEAQVDSTARAKGKVNMGGKRAEAQRKRDIESVATGIYRRAMQQQDSLRAGPIRNLRSAAMSDSTDAAQPIQLPSSFTDLFK